jgi:hypothetical protein
LFLVLGLLVFASLLPIAAPLVGLAAVVVPTALEKTVRAAAMLIFAGLVSGIAAVVQIAFATKLMGAAPTSLSTSIILLAATVVARRWLKPLMSVSAVLRTVTGRPAKAAASVARYRALTRMITASSHTGTRGGGNRAPDPTWVDPRRRSTRPEASLWGRSGHHCVTRPRPATPPSDPHGLVPSGPGVPPGPNGPGAGSARPATRRPAVAGGARRRPRVAGHPPPGHPGSARADAAAASPWPRPTTRPSPAARDGATRAQAGWWTPPGALYWPSPRPTTSNPLNPPPQDSPPAGSPPPPRPDGAPR